MIEELVRRVTELERLLTNVVMIGSIIEADYDTARVRAKSDRLETGWLPWVTSKAVGDTDWWAPEIGEQVVILSPAGRPELGVILPAIYQQSAPAPETDPDIRAVAFDDGTTIKYNRATHELKVDVADPSAKIHLSSAGSMELDCTGALDISASQINIAGPVVQTGGDMTSDGISGQHHKHLEQGDGNLVSEPQ